MQEFDENLEECGIEELYLRPQSPTLPQTEHLYRTTLRELKDRLEEMYRMNTEEFYHRKSLIQQAIKERERGKEELMPGFTLGELRSALDFANQLYR